MQQDNTAPYVVEAFNTATESENKIHDDSVARRFGFSGGLVPGVEVYGYMTQPCAKRWGLAWLEHGALSARFLTPVYDGAEALVRCHLVDDALSIELESGGLTCATGKALLRAANAERPFDIAEFPETLSPAFEDRPQASTESLIEGAMLGHISEVFAEDMLSSYLEDIRERLSLYNDHNVAPSGFLLRRANSILVNNVELGPWIHVESEVRHHSLLRVGQPFSTRARVKSVYEHKGHRFVDLDVTIWSDGCLVMDVMHRSIYEPRQVRERD